MTDDLQPEQTTPTKRQRSRHVKPIRLQDRDLDMFVSLSVGRYLSVPAIEWLHYPGWRERYAAYLERRKADPSVVFYPAPNIYHRLVAMRASPQPLIYRVARTVERASLVYTKLPDAYTLAEAGAELLCVRRGYELDDIWYEDPRQRSIKNFEHSVAIGTFYAALRAALEFSGRQLDDWRGDHLLIKHDPVSRTANYDRIAVPGMKKLQPILPDATFTLNGHRYFVEIDMGTTNLRSWGEKVRAYEAYRTSTEFTTRYTTAAFTVLVVAPSEVRQRRIAEEVLKVTRQATSSYLFLTEERVHPTTLRPSWKAVQKFEWGRRKRFDRYDEVPEKILFTPHHLWRNP